jgi:hypothetical protein
VLHQPSINCSEQEQHQEAGFFSYLGGGFELSYTIFPPRRLGIESGALRDILNHPWAWVPKRYADVNRSYDEMKTLCALISSGKHPLAVR